MEHFPHSVAESKTDDLVVTVKLRQNLTVLNPWVLVKEALAKQHKNVLIMLKALERFCFIAFIVCESPVLFTGARNFSLRAFSHIQRFWRQKQIRTIRKAIRKA